ncbi:uncharacterized protein LOC115658871 isoform X2 [Gopherus evgoodei]|uniref:uncharacterized protein LOC115658871 isoform X2 n=1 Tax=Gopherus evgoodei TaxID=1825980 RepID=UPI0011CFA0B9|nr:uncharacterized protein LOC115658871 isoform X2 [Gopherus evgoodei]
MYFLVILAFLGRITGETFFRHYENGNFTLKCNGTVANEKETIWYEAEESLQEFQVINYCSNQQPKVINGPNKCSDKTKCTNQLSTSDSKGGGVFACEQFINTGTSQTCPLFTNVTHCRHYNFFIVVIINMTADKETFETIPSKSHDNHLVEEESNITLSCEFQMKQPKQTFVIYWIKYTETSKCLFSAAREQYTLSYNTHCCIDEMIEGRLVNYTSLDSEEKHVVHNMTILNVTDSDSGTYLCVVNSWARNKHVWKIANNLSIEVRNQAIPCKPPAQLPRAQAALEISGDECSPYAVSSSKDFQRNEVLYSLATSPYEDPNAAYCTVGNTATSGKGTGDEIHTVYAVVPQ